MKGKLQFSEFIVQPQTESFACASLHSSKPAVSSPVFQPINPSSLERLAGWQHCEKWHLEESEQTCADFSQCQIDSVIWSHANRMKGKDAPSSLMPICPFIGISYVYNVLLFYFILPFLLAFLLGQYTSTLFSQ